jgi:hypothetical protein
VIYLDYQQIFFTELLVGLKKKGYSVYDGKLPPDGTKYPFIYLDSSSQTDTHLKAAVIGSMTQKIAVWHNNEKERGTVSEMLADIKQISRVIVSKHSWIIESMSQRILSDETTKTPLLHGVLDISLKFS